MWGSQSVQLVWFTNAAESVNADAFFSCVFGQPALNTQRSRSPNAFNPFYSSASGDIDDVQGVVHVQPGRVDLILTPFEGPDVDPLHIPLLKTKEVLDRIMGNIGALIALVPGILRVATVANLVLQTANEEESNKKIMELVGLPDGISEASDLIFQMNRRKSFEFDRNVVMNRVIKYHSLISQQYVITPTVVAPTSIPMNAPLFGVNVTVDVNTMVINFELQRESLMPIFEDIAAEVLRISADTHLSAVWG